MNTHTYIHWIRPRFSLSLSLRIHLLHPSSSSSTITRPKFTSDPTIIFHGFAEWLRSFRNKNPRSLVAANHDFWNFKGSVPRRKISTSYYSLLLLFFFFTHWYSCLRFVDWRRWKRGFFNRRVNIPSLAKHPFALDVSLKLDARGTNKKLRQWFARFVLVSL